MKRPKIKYHSFEIIHDPKCIFGNPSIKVKAFVKRKNIIHFSDVQANIAHIVANNEN